MLDFSILPGALPVLHGAIRYDRAAGRYLHAWHRTSNAGCRLIISGFILEARQVAAFTTNKALMPGVAEVQHKTDQYNV